MRIKRIGAITMVRNDEFFLRKWVDHYGEAFGRENLHILFDGTDQKVPEFCSGTNVEVVEKIGDTVRSSDKGRIQFISERAALLFADGYDLVVGGDADEYLAIDPRLNLTLPEYLSAREIKTTLSGLGLDFGQKEGEPSLSLDRPFLEQRRYAQIGTRYTKASVLGSPLEWGSGFHRVERHNFHIGKDLYLMHFGYSDKEMIEGRLTDADRKKQGWEKHVSKRSRTIRLVNSLPAKDFDTTVAWTRKMETLCRPPYAWNKPALLGMKIVVEIPERFRTVL